MFSEAIPVKTTWQQAVYDNFSEYVITDIHRKANGELMATAMTPDGTKGILLASKNGQVWQRADYDGCFAAGLTACASMNYSDLFLGGHDGSVVVGWQDIYGPWYASVWRRGDDGQYTQRLMLLDPTKNEDEIDFSNQPEMDANLMGYAFTISSDGKWIGGSGGARNAFPGPWLCNEEEGYIFLSEYDGCVSDITNDGTMAVGWDGYGSNAWIWQKDENGNGELQSLQDYAESVLKLDLGNFIICSVYDISPNGRYVTGYGMDGMDKRAYVLDLLGNTDGIEAVAARQVKAAVYPNPVADELHIDLPYDASEVATTLRLVNMEGRTVRTLKEVSRSNSMEVASIPAGHYVLTVDAAGEHKSFKVIIKH